MIERDSVTAYLPFSPRRAPRPPWHRSGSPAGRRDRPHRREPAPSSFSSASTFWPNFAPRPASSSLIAASRSCSAFGSFAPDLTKPFQCRSSTRVASRSRPRLVAAFPERVDAGKQRRVHADLRIVPRHFRRDVALQRLDRVVGMGAGAVPEQRRDARQPVAGDLQRDDGVFEGRRLRVVGDRVDLRLMLGKCRVEGRRKIAVADRPRSAAARPGRSSR